MRAPRPTLPEPPEVELEPASETHVGKGGFLALRRLRLVVVQNGQRSASFRYDLVDRKALDAAIMVAHHVVEGRVCVWLRSSVRPPVGLRPNSASSVVLWEVPAGLIEPGETARQAATRELAEELGFAVDEEAMLELGPRSFPAPALIGEVHHYFHVRVDATQRTEPEGDGSPLEAGAVVLSVPLDEALQACRRGELRDAKTELALRRLDEILRTPRTS